MSQAQLNILPAIIVGGGIVGGLTSLLLAQGGVQATVLDQAPVLDAEKILSQHNPRALALTQATIQLLKKAQVWQSLLDSKRYMPFTGMQAWNNHGYGEILLGKASQNPQPHDWLGVMIEPSVLVLYIQQQMLKQLQDYRPNTQVKRIEKQRHNAKTIWSVSLNTGETLYTELLIGADGANSFVRDQANIGVSVLDYKQSVLSCVVRTSEHHLHTPRQMYNPTPFALLPMAGRVAEDNGYLHSLAWSLDTASAERYKNYSKEDFEQLLNQESCQMLGKIQVLTMPTAFPVKARAAKRYTDEGLVLVGDAAHTIHPLAGQGMNLGCLDAGVLCDTLLSDLERGSWAKRSTLKRYEHRRRGHNLVMMHSMSMMGWMELLQDTPFRWALNWGRKQVNQTDWIRNFLIYQANGLGHLRQTRYIH